MITTTIAKIKEYSPCQDGYRKLCKSLGGIKNYGIDTPITFKQIYESNGYDDTLWCLRATDEKYHNLWRHLAVDYAKQAEHLMEDKKKQTCFSSIS